MSAAAAFDALEMPPLPHTAGDLMVTILRKKVVVKE